MTNSENPSEARKLAEEAKRLAWQFADLSDHSLGASWNAVVRAIDRLASLSPAPTPEDRAVADQAVEAQERSIVDPTHSARDMRRFAALWRYGREVLPTSGVPFDGWMFQLDMLIDSKTHGLPFEECPSIATPSQPELLEDREGQAVAVSGEAKWLPTAPTDAMLDAGAMEVAMLCQRVQTAERGAEQIYRAMAKAAPQATSSQTGSRQPVISEQAPVAEAPYAWELSGTGTFTNVEATAKLWLAAKFDVTPLFRSSTRKSADEGQKEQAVASRGTTPERLRGVIALAWCHRLNKHKEMDSEIVEAVVAELFAAGLVSYDPSLDTPKEA